VKAFDLTPRLRAHGRGALGLALLLGSVALNACRHAPPPPPQLPSPAAADLPLPDAIPGAFTVRQKLVARSSHGGGSFEAVLKKSPAALTLVGLTPYGSRAFLLEQKGAEVTFTSYIPRDLPFSPTFVLQDVHRVFDAPLGAELPEGEREGVVKDSLVRERWHQGRLQFRSYGPREPATAPPIVTIAYEGTGPAGLPAHVLLTHQTLGYTLVVETLPM